MKKMTRFFLMAAVALGLLACNKDEAPKSDNNGDGDVWASFTISMPSKRSAFRDAANDVDNAKKKDTFIGTQGEQEVKSVRVVLYDAEKKHVAYKFDFDIKTDGNAAFNGGDVADGTNPTKSTFVTKAKKVVQKDYKVLVLLNPTQKAKDVTENVGTDIYKFEEAVVTTVEGLTKDGFFMSNAQGLVDVPKGSLKDTDTAAEQAPISVNVDRAVAKVFVGGVPEVAHNATFTQIKWTLDVTNKKTFLMRKLALKVTGKDQFAAEIIGDNSERYDRYAEDPNFKDGHAISQDDFNYYTKDGFIAENLFKDAGYEDAKGIYALENTMAKEHQYNSVTTRVILKGVYKPADKDASGEIFNEGDDWYSYKGFKMTKVTFDKYLQKVKKQGNGNHIDGTPNGFAGDIHTLVTENQNFTEKSFSKHNLKFYKGGICYYYNIYIRHFDDEQSSIDMNYGRYGLVRNNIYKLTLGKISQPGEPEIEQPDPNQPDDPIQQYVSFQVTVLPWLVREQTINL